MQEKLKLADLIKSLTWKYTDKISKIDCLYPITSALIRVHFSALFPSSSLLIWQQYG